MANSHGRFAWYVLMTTDMEAAKAFYTDVVGWRARDASMPGRPYTVFTAGEKPVTAVMNMPQNAGITGPCWIGYVTVNDVDATAQRIKQLGGSVHYEPQDILGVSRFAVVVDPQNATLALFKWLKPPPGQPVEQDVDLHARGLVGWHELHAADGEKAWPVYSEIFGWQKAEAEVSVTGTYQLFSVGGQTIGSMYTKLPSVPVPCWLYYFNVGDIVAAARRVKAGGGQIISGPSEVPGGNWIVKCTDPQGAVFALVGNNSVGYFERVPRPASKPVAPPFKS